MRKAAVKEVLEKELAPQKVEEMIKEMEKAGKNGNGKKLRLPEGGISLSKASRKYRIPISTIKGWVDNGSIPTILITAKEKYIKEDIVANIAKIYRKGRGNRRILKFFSEFANS